MLVQPINEVLKQKIIVEVQRYVDIAATLYHMTFEPVDVLFDIKGRAAGIYHSSNRAFKSFMPYLMRKRCYIRFNPWLFAKYPDDSWTNTIPHEVAHYISDCRYGLNNIKPHGVEWCQIMRDFGANPIVRGDYSLDGIPVRRLRRYVYRCACRHVELTSIRHRRVQGGGQQYRCRHCSDSLVFCGSEV
jgi:SprT protein